MTILENTKKFKSKSSIVLIGELRLRSSDWKFEMLKFFAIHFNLYNEGRELF